jgi:hypothetical protein
MSELVPYTSPAPPARGFAAEWLTDPAEIARVVGGTEFVPAGLRNNAPAITAALLFGEEVGLRPMMSLARIAVINGRPTLAAEAQRALILRAGHQLWIDELTITRCTVAGQRRGSDQVSRVTWTMDDARRANLAGKTPWKLYPRQMLLARASAELARAVFPDAIGGLAATEELEDEPEVAAIDNGEQPKATTRRRRRQTPAAAPPSPEPPPTSAPDPADGSPEPPGGSQEPESESGLTPDEQRALEQLEDEFGARVVEEGSAAPPSDADPPPAEAPLSDAQQKKMQALFREKGIVARDDKLAYVRGVIGRHVDSSRELTVPEASKVIVHLSEYDPANPQTYPLPEDF